MLLTEPEPGEILEGAARDLCHTKANRGAFKVQQVDELFGSDKKTLTGIIFVLFIEMEKTEDNTALYHNSQVFRV